MFIISRKLQIGGAALLAPFLLYYGTAARQDGPAGNQDPAVMVKNLDRVSRELNQTAAGFDRALDLARLHASAREKLGDADANQTAVRTGMERWRAARMTESTREAIEAAIVNIQKNAERDLGAEKGAAFGDWIRDRDAEVEKILQELNRLGHEVEEMSIALSRESAARAIHTQEDLQKNFDEATRIAAKAEEDLRLRAEILSKPLAEKLFKLRESLDVDALLAAARDRWKLSLEESVKIRAILERFRDSETSQKTEAEQREFIKNLGADSIAMLAEKRAVEFEAWLRLRHDALRAVLDELTNAGRTAREDWAAAATRAALAVKNLDQLREDQAKKNLEARKLADQLVAELNTRVAPVFQTIRKTAPGVLKQLQLEQPEYNERVATLRERGRLARERAAKMLDDALQTRGASIENTQKKFDEAMAAFENVRRSSALEWEQNLQRFFVETSATLRDLAQRNRETTQSRVDAVRKLWEGLNPAERARGLEAREREKMKADQERAKAELQKTRDELERVQKALEEIQRKATG
ncbi:MAG: hypothetical protein HY286_07305 [Planctomycetes bacterium]|nr:hypothetical protein [Planctomycetota bacterium]